VLEHGSAHSLTANCPAEIVDHPNSRRSGELGGGECVAPAHAGRIQRHEVPAGYWVVIWYIVPPGVPPLGLLVTPYSVPSSVSTIEPVGTWPLVKV